MEVLGEDVKPPGRRSWPVIVTILALFLSFVGYVFFADDGPPDDDWILPRIDNAPGGKSPLERFCEVAQANRTDSVTYTKLFKGAKVFEKISTEDMRAFVDRHSVTIEAFDLLLQTNISTWAWPGMDQRITLTADISYLSSLQETASQLQRMRVELLVRAGKKEEAIAEALKTTRFGLGISRGDGLLISWLVGMSCQRIGETSLRSALSMPGVDAEKLREALEALASLDPGFGQFQQILSWEYLALKNTLLPDKSRNSQEARYIDESLNGKSAIFLRRNRTLSTYLFLMRPVHVAAARDWPDLMSAFADEQERVKKWQSNWLSFNFNSNATGNEMLSELGPTMSNICAKAAQFSALHRQAEIMIALRRYELAEGKLPEKLGALVPKYLPTVPEDPFDKAPMRWEAAAGKLYSIGPDLVDHLGSFEEPRKNMDKDVGMNYWWKARAPAR